MFLYIICELLKYRRIDSIKLSISRKCYAGKLYNERIVFLKAFLLGIDVVLLIIYLISGASVIEKTSGVRGIALCLFPFVMFGCVCYRDIRRVIHGHNERIEEGESNA